MKLPKWHERAESSDIKIKDQDILDGKNFLTQSNDDISKDDETISYTMLKIFFPDKGLSEHFITS